MIHPEAFYPKKDLAKQIGMDAGPIIAAYDENRLEATQCGRSVGWYGRDLIKFVRTLPKVTGMHMSEKHSRKNQAKS